MGLFEDDILEDVLDDDVLLLHLAVLLLLAHDDAFALGLEQDAAAGNGLGVTVVDVGDTDAGEADLEDAQALDADLLAQFEVVLHGLAQLVEHGTDITLLHRGLLLDKGESRFLFWDLMYF